VEFLPEIGLDAGNRRCHDVRTAPEHRTAFKAKVAFAAIKGAQTMVELYQQFYVRAHSDKQWKDQLFEGGDRRIWR